MSDSLRMRKVIMKNLDWIFYLDSGQYDQLPVMIVIRLYQSVVWRYSLSIYKVIMI